MTSFHEKVCELVVSLLNSNMERGISVLIHEVHTAATVQEILYIALIIPPGLAVDRAELGIGDLEEEREREKKRGRKRKREESEEERRKMRREGQWK